MIDINKYILEKLKINKDIKLNNFEYKKDSLIFIINVFYEFNHFRLYCYDIPIKIIDFKNNILTLDNFDKNYNVKLNSNNYYEEHKVDDPINNYTIIIPAEEAIIFWENFKRDKENYVDKSCLKNYFDKTDEFFNKKINICCYFKKNVIEKIIQNIKNKISK